MSLQSLLAAGAERVATAYMSGIPWQTDSRGRQVRRALNQADRRAIRERVERRVGPLNARDRAALDAIVAESDNATRRARQLDRDPGRLPRPSEITRVPGTGNRGGDTYTYTTVVRFVDGATGEVRSTTLVIQDRSILSGEQVRARAVELASRGEIVSRQGTNPPSTAARRVFDVQILSVYRGSPEL
jgi:hypothetical protein